MKYAMIFLFLSFGAKIEAPKMQENKTIEIAVPYPASKASDYLATYAQIALEVERRYNVPFEICLAQAAVESDCGQSELAKQSNNQFGMKAIKGEAFVIHQDDIPNDRFVVYASVRESFLKYGKRLSGKRYGWMKKAYGLDWEKWADGLQKSGYATNKNYAKTIKQYVRKNRISNYRHIAF